jgi:PST family polysaccharide transporter
LSVFATAITWSATGSWLQQAILFVVYVLLARRLGPEAYGLFGMAAVAISLAYTILVDSAGLYVVRAPDLEPGHLDAVFWLQIAVAAALSTAMIAGAGPVAWFYREPVVAPLLRSAALLPPLYAFSSIPSSLLRRQLRFQPLAVRSLLSACAGGAAGLVLAAQGWGPFSLLAMAVVQQAAQIICLWPAARWRPRFTLLQKHVTDVLAFSRHAVAVNIMAVVNLQAPRVALGAWLGAEALGCFTMAWRLIEVISILTIMSVTQAAIPVISRGLEDETGATRADQTLLVCCAIGLPCFAGLFATAPTLISALFGPRWQAAIPAIRAAAAMGLVWTPVLALDAALIARGQMRARTYITAAQTILLAPVLWVALPCGAAAVLAGMAVRDTAILVIYFATFARYRQQVSAETVRRLLRIAAIAIGMTLSVLAWLRLLGPWLEPRLLFVSAVAAGAAIYAAGLALSGLAEVSWPARALND